MTYILIQGIVVGSLYALIAIGPSLVYGLMGVLDVASAAALTLGAYLLLVVFQASGSVLLGVAAALVLAGVVGWVFQKSLYVPILDRGPIVTLVTSIGVYICADELFRLVFGPLQQSLGIQIAIPDLHIAGTEVTGINLLIIVIGVGLLLLTWLVLTKTRYGVVWRAVAQDRDIASAVGIDSKKVIGGVFVIGYALSALAGILYALKYDSVIPTMGDVPAYKMLAIIILGGLGSPLGTIAAAFLIGLVETAVVAEFGFVVPRDAIAFAALVLVLLIRPQGLIPSRVVRMSYLLVLLITMTILSTVTVSLNMVVGYTGQPNLGQSAVFGIGAYFAAVFATSYSMPFWFCFVAAGLAAGIAGALIGAISLRLHQDFFAITTLGLNFIVVATFQTLPFFGGATGLYGIPLPTIAGYELDYPGLAVCSLLLLLCTVGVSLLVNRSWFGGILQAIREDETLAASLGAPVARYKSMVFIISSIFAGFAGCLYAYFLSTVSPQTFGFNDSVLFLAMLLIGGSATIRGAIFGAVLLTIIPELFRFASEYRMLIFGAVLVLVLRFHPQGLIGDDSLIARWTANVFAGKRARP